MLLGTFFRIELLACVVFGGVLRGVPCNTTPRYCKGTEKPNCFSPVIHVYLPGTPLCRLVNWLVGLLSSLRMPECSSDLHYQ